MVAAIVCGIVLPVSAARWTTARATSCSGISRPLGESFDGMAVAVARREVHVRVGARGILAQHPLDQADPLEEHRPVDRREQPHARDHVADRQLVGRLALMLDAQHFFGRIVLRLERALQRLRERGGGGG